MNKKELLDEILLMLKTVMEDREKLEKIHRYMKDEIYEEIQEEEFEKRVYEELVDKGIIKNNE